MRRAWTLGAVLFAVAAFGCRSEPRRVAPHDHEALTGLNGGIPDDPRNVPESAIVIVDRAPPPPREERPRYRERYSVEFVWVPGYWSWEPRISDFVWIPGGWVRAPRERAWIAARWVALDDGRYRFLPGYWR